MIKSSFRIGHSPNGGVRALIEDAKRQRPRNLRQQRDDSGDVLGYPFK
jgi:hypothetical protein